MKKIFANILVFVIVFCAAYTMLCFTVPGMKVETASAAGTFFVKSICHAAPIKAAVSAAAAAVTAVESNLLLKKLK